MNKDFVILHWDVSIWKRFIEFYRDFNLNSIKYWTTDATNGQVARYKLWIVCAGTNTLININYTIYSINKYRMAWKIFPRNHIKRLFSMIDKYQYGIMRSTLRVCYSPHSLYTLCVRDARSLNKPFVLCNIVFILTHKKAARWCYNVWTSFFRRNEFKHLLDILMRIITRTRMIYTTMTIIIIIFICVPNNIYI